MKKKQHTNKAHKASPKRVEFSLVFALDEQTDLKALSGTIDRINPKNHSFISQIFIFTSKSIPENVSFNLPDNIEIIINPSAEIIRGSKKENHRLCLLNLQQTAGTINLNELLSENSEALVDNIATQIIVPDHKNLAKCSQAPILLLEPEFFGFVLPYISEGHTINWWMLLHLIGKEDITPVYYPFQQTKTSQYPTTKLSTRIKALLVWHKSIPVDILTKKNKQPAYLNDNPIWRLSFISLVSILFIIMIALSTTVGISGDEKVNYRHAKEVYEYFASGGEDKDALNTPKTKLKYYGQSFDNLTYLINKTFNIENEYTSRHILNAITGWLGILFAGLAAMLIGGWRAGVITLLLLFLSPRYLGHSFNNPKDIPFAVSYVFFLFFTLRMIKNYPAKLLPNLSGVALGIGMAISVRIGGLLLIGYLFMFYGLFWIISYTQWLPEVKAKIKHAGIVSFLWIAIASLVGYGIGIIYWPFALQDPIKNPFEALKVMTNFLASIKQTFNGTIYWSNTLPWYYSLKYMLITIPLLVLAGLSIFIFYQFHKQRPINKFLSLLVVFAWAFPIIYIIYRNSNVYGGWRHLLFSYPPAVILAGLGINGIITVAEKNKKTLLITCIILLAGVVPPLQHIIRNHPHTYLYFNAFTGGIKGALGNYEMDYYFNSLRPGATWFKDNILSETTDTVIIASNHADILKSYFTDEPVKINYVRYYQAGNTDWDYAIIANANISPYQLKNGLWPPRNTIHTISTASGVPLCAIIKREHKEDLRGNSLVKQEKFYEAIPPLIRAMEYDSTNIAAALNLAKSLLSISENEKAKEVMLTALSAYPSYDKLHNMLGISYMRMGSFSDAISTFEYIIEISPNYISAYFNLGLTYLQMNNETAALAQFQRAIQLNPRYKQAYLMIARILEYQGNEEQAKRYREAAERL